MCRKLTFNTQIRSWFECLFDMRPGYSDPDDLARQNLSPETVNVGDRLHATGFSMARDF